MVTKKMTLEDLEKTENSKTLNSLGLWEDNRIQTTKRVAKTKLEIER